MLSFPAGLARGYDNFKVSVCSRAYETRAMNDVKGLEPRWTGITRQVHIDKIYLETHRDLIVVDEATLLAAKKFFADPAPGRARRSNFQSNLIPTGSFRCADTDRGTRRKDSRFPELGRRDFV
jgi:hypothetical protein